MQNLEQNEQHNTNQFPYDLTNKAADLLPNLDEKQKI